MSSAEQIPVEVINIKSFQGDRNTVVYCGRPSVLGNPFHMRSEEQRSLVCEKYRLHFQKRIQEDGRFRLELENLVDKAKQDGYLRLGCFCAPKSCHVDTIAAYVRQRLSNLSD